MGSNKEKSSGEESGDEEKDRAIDYLSRMMVGAEDRYPPVEKECLALM